MTILGAARESETRDHDNVETDLEKLHNDNHGDTVNSPSTPVSNSHSLKPKDNQSKSSAVPKIICSAADEDKEEDAGEPLLDTGDFSPDVTKAEVKEEEKEDGVPYDRGWAWVIVFGLFINFLLLSGYLKSSGLFFVELLRKFNAPATHTALLFSIRAGVFSVWGFYVMNVLLSRFGSRKLTLTGAIFMALSAILSSFANNLTLLICIHSFLLAAGMSMVISPGEVLVGTYFKERRSLALALAKCGASVGNVAVPPLITFLLANFGLTGTLLLYGAICLHSVPAALLFRPVSYFTKQHVRRLHQKTGECDANQHTGNSGRFHQKPGKCDMDLETKSYCRNGATRTGNRHPTSIEMADGQKTLVSVEIVSPDEVGTPKSKPRRGNNRPPYLWSKSEIMPPQILNVVEYDVSELAQSNPELGGLPTRTPPFRKRTLSELPEWNFQTHNSTHHSKPSILQAISQSSVVRAMSVSSLDVATSSLIIQPSPLDIRQLEHEDGQHCDSNNKDQKSSFSCGRLLKSVLLCPKNFILMLDFSLFRSPLFHLLLVFIIFSPFVNMTLDYFPALATENGISESRSALLLSIVGGLDLVSRLCCGLLADTKVLRVTTIIAGGFIILGIVTQFVRLMSTFEHFVLLAVLQGMFGGVANCLIPVLIIEFVGLKNMGKGIGFCQLVSGASMAAVYPLLGYIRDTTGSYAIPYHVIGCGTLIAAVVVSLERPVRRFEEKRNEHKQEQGIPGSQV